MDYTIDLCNDLTEDKRVEWLMLSEGCNALKQIDEFLGNFGGLMPEYEKRLEAFLERVERDERIRELCLKTTEGRWFYLQWIPMKEGTGVVIRDVTQERSTQILGQVCADKWEVLTVNPGLCFCVADLTDDEVLYCCPWIQLEGGVYETVIQQMSEQFVAPEDDEVFQTLFSRCALLTAYAAQRDHLDRPN